MTDESIRAELDAYRAETRAFRAEVAAWRAEDRAIWARLEIRLDRLGLRVRPQVADLVLLGGQGLCGAEGGQCFVTLGKGHCATPRCWGGLPYYSLYRKCSSFP